jgi:hypothetical protein
MQHLTEFALTVGGLCNLASAAVNLAAAIIKFRRGRMPAAAFRPHED